jgi:hypothetical protein
MGNHGVLAAASSMQSRHLSVESLSRLALSIGDTLIPRSWSVGVGPKR